MCLAVYLASDTEVPEVPFNNTSPSFYVEEVGVNDEVRRQFRLPFVYYAGSNQGCGCGFSKEGQVGEDLEKSQSNYYALSQVIRSAQARGANTEVFTCWEGDQSDPPESVESVTTHQLEAEGFELQQLQLLRVRPDA